MWPNPQEILNGKLIFCSVKWSQIICVVVRRVLRSIAFVRIYCVCLKSKTLCICWNIVEVGTRQYFTDYQTANTVHLFVAIKGKFPGLFFFWTGRSKGKAQMPFLNLTSKLFFEPMCNMFIISVYYTKNKWFYSLYSFVSIALGLSFEAQQMISG